MPAEGMGSQKEWDAIQYMKQGYCFGPHPVREESNMSSRIGDVLYWLGCIVAALTAGVGIVSYAGEGYRRSDGLWLLVVFLTLATIPWLIGKASRYILSAR